MSIVTSFAPAFILNGSSWQALHLYCIRWIQCGKMAGGMSSVPSAFRLYWMSPYSAAWQAGHASAGASSSTADQRVEP